MLYIAIITLSISSISLERTSNSNLFQQGANSKSIADIEGDFISKIISNTKNNFNLIHVKTPKFIKIFGYSFLKAFLVISIFQIFVYRIFIFKWGNTFSKY